MSDNPTDQPDDAEELHYRHKATSELTYRDYRDGVETTVEAVRERRDADPEAFDADPHDHIHELVGEDWWHTTYGAALMAVLLSDTDPDAPDYCEPWTTYVDLSDPRDLSWTDTVTAQAYVCYLSDVIDLAHRTDRGDGDTLL